MVRNVYCLGPAGTHSHEAALRLKGKRDTIIFERSLSRVMDALYSGECAVVPIENRGGGQLVGDVIRFIVGKHESREHDGSAHPRITSELTLPIQHNLLVHPTFSGVVASRILTHSQAVAQCDVSDFNIEFCTSTAEAAKRLSEESDLWPRHGAIASRLSAEIYGLHIKRSDLQRSMANRTRFIMFNGQKQNVNEGIGWRTSLIFTIENLPRALIKVLEVFGESDINVSTLHSIDFSGHGKYFFYIEFDEQMSQQIFQKLQKAGARGRSLGSYRRSS